MSSESSREENTPSPRKPRTRKRELGFEHLQNEGELEISCEEKDVWGDRTPEIYSQLLRSSSPSRSSTTEDESILSDASVSYLEVVEDSEEQFPWRKALEHVCELCKNLPTKAKWLTFSLIVLAVLVAVIEHTAHRNTHRVNDVKVLLRKHNISDSLSRKAALWTTKRLNDKHLLQPVVVLFALTNEKMSLVTEFSDVAKKIRGVQVAEFHSRDFSSKIHLDFTVDNALAKGNIVLLRSIEQLTGDMPLVIHTFCDPDSAKHLSSVLLLSVTLQEVPKNHRVCEELVHSSLMGHWSASLAQSKVSAVISRAAPVVICG
ncbi:hypothetical protein QR680_017539 [Steinernema hermaphroditum]|uniref:Uncharacterized protein n=1 Tax=Steinernema hermaphroditum TaxID=289476 RepID=A0AA39LPB4_9BILA|nr:hypothetical protein QR680_017539 [Steinernema hermaphroditum]